jgi:hypothetical protein
MIMIMIMIIVIIFENNIDSFIAIKGNNDYHFFFKIIIKSTINLNFNIIIFNYFLIIF